MKTAWLVEMKCAGGPAWIYVEFGTFGWTTIANDALKFADERSAKRVCEMFMPHTVLPDAVFATEHSWPDGD